MLLHWCGGGKQIDSRRSGPGLDVSIYPAGSLGEIPWDNLKGSLAGGHYSIKLDEDCRRVTVGGRLDEERDVQILPLGASEMGSTEGTLVLVSCTMQRKAGNDTGSWKLNGSDEPGKIGLYSKDDRGRRERTYSTVWRYLVFIIRMLGYESRVAASLRSLDCQYY